MTEQRSKERPMTSTTTPSLKWSGWSSRYGGGGATALLRWSFFFQDSRVQIMLVFTIPVMLMNWHQRRPAQTLHHSGNRAPTGAAAFLSRRFYTERQHSGSIATTGSSQVQSKSSSQSERQYLWRSKAENFRPDRAEQNPVPAGKRLHRSTKCHQIS